jgi:hypothetical protein
MNVVAFVIGIGITTVIGWLALRLAEGKSMVMTREERLAWGFVLGPTLGMFVVFVCHIVGLVKLNLIGFLIPQIVLILLLAAGVWKFGSLRFAGATGVLAPSKTYPQWIKIGILILCAWTALKIFAGAYDLISVPTYWDDSFNNWNMRGKMFYFTEELTLVIPVGNGFVADEQGVSSYPPMLPMVKTWVSVLRGEWSEGLINGVHLVWFIGLLAAFYCTLRRSFDPLLSAFGVYLLVSLPLLLIHGSNPYAEIFTAAHIFLAISALLGLRRATVSGEIQSWTKIFFLTLALLILTKNEALLLHTPLLVLIALAYDLRTKQLIGSMEHRKTIAVGFATVLVIVLPWLAFKWLNGLTFGNAKSVSGFELAFNMNVLKAIWFHFAQEANWLLLPLALPLALIAAGKKFWITTESLLATFVLADIGLQIVLFIVIPSLATEAINQTGLSRGLLQIAPVATLLLMFLAKSERRS